VSVYDVPNAGNDLLRFHKAITRALEVSLQNCGAGIPEEKHRPGFLAYVRALTIVLKGHHEGEDRLAFPFWRVRLPSGPFDFLTEQHRLMTIHLERLAGLLEACSADAGSDGIWELHRPLSALEALWLPHTALEEEAMGPEPSLKYLTREENEELSALVSKHGQERSRPSELVLPFVVYNLSGRDRDGYLKLLPPVVSRELIPRAWKDVWTPMTPFLSLE
jgi:hypothetical protein